MQILDHVQNLKTKLKVNDLMPKIISAKKVGCKIPYFQVFLNNKVIRKSCNVLEGIFFGSRETGKAASQSSIVLANGGLPDLPAETIGIILFK